MTPVLVPEHHIADHRDQVRQRWEALRATGVLQERADRVQASMDHGSFERMASAAAKAKACGQRVRWLHRAADVLGRAVSQAEAAACKKGCAHCCHIPVLCLARRPRTWLPPLARKWWRPLSTLCRWRRSLIGRRESLMQTMRSWIDGGITSDVPAPSCARGRARCGLPGPWLAGTITHWIRTICCAACCLTRKGFKYLS